MFDKMSPEQRRLVAGLTGYLLLIQTIRVIDKKCIAKNRKVRQMPRRSLIDLDRLIPRSPNSFEQLRYDHEFHQIIADF